ncbi:MAG: dipeptidase [Thermoflexibacteraceae bacterium]
MQIADAHCDLLAYLLYDEGHQYDDVARCAIPQLKAGNVIFQTLAIYTNSSDESSSMSGYLQSELFKDLIEEETELRGINTAEDLKDLEESGQIGVMASIENASGFCAEGEDINDGFRNLEAMIDNVGGRLLYISLTHHHKNRFGGGNYTRTGLRDDGCRVLDYLDGRGIAVDFSHTSDKLAYDILNYITTQNLDIPVMASHSNLRVVHKHRRNLPTEIAQEILQRGGVIGFNWIKEFLGKNWGYYIKNMNTAFDIFGEDAAICMGTDFFYSPQLEEEDDSDFFEGYQTAADYPSMIETLLDTDLFSEEQLANFTKNNLLNFVERLLVQ